MAALGDAGNRFGDGFATNRPTAAETNYATAAHPDSRPAPQGGLVLVGPIGGTRG